jgi:hypothetical protein
MEVMPEPTLINEKLLRKAWELFDIYDRTAIATQKRFLNFRIAILVVGVVSTVLVVIKSQYPLNNSDNQVVNILGMGLNGLVILAPISVSVLLAASVKLDRGMNWILLRASAEIIKKQIYLYRVGVCAPKDADKLLEKEILLAKEIQVVSDRLMKTQVNRSGLVIDSNKSKNDNLLSLLIKEKILNPTQKLIEETLKWIREKLGISSEKAQTDDRFSSLTVEKYLEYRLIDQLSWYRSKTVKLDSQWQFLQWSIYLWGGLGTFLAAVNKEIWVAITNAIATTISSFLDFKQLDSTLVCYNQAACNLENVLCWWYALTDQERTDSDNIKKLVNSTEDVIQAATSSWVAEMSEALSKLYEEKAKNEDK